MDEKVNCPVCGATITATWDFCDGEWNLDHAYCAACGDDVAEYVLEAIDGE